MAAHYKEDNPSESFLYKGKTIYSMGDGRFYERKITKGNPRGQRFYWKYTSCCVCNNQVLLPISQISRADGKSTCGKKCWIQSRSGQNHHAWKSVTEKVRSNGKTALKIWMPSHPSAKKGRVYEHRLVMEKKIGRLLFDEEVVHHIDCDAHNNDPENLSLCANGRVHMIAHGTLLSCVKGLLATGKLAFDEKTKSYFLP